MTREEWLAGLKVGDEVAFMSGSAIAEQRIANITSATGAHVVVCGAKFDRKRGNEVTKSTWFRAQINPITDVVLEQVEASRLRSRIVGAIESRSDTFKTLPLSALRQIADLLGVKP